MNEKNFSKYFKTFRDNNVLDHNIFNRLLSDLRKIDYSEKMGNAQIIKSENNIDITLKYTDINDKKITKNIVFEGLYKRLKKKSKDMEKELRMKLILNVLLRIYTVFSSSKINLSLPQEFKKKIDK